MSRPLRKLAWLNIGVILTQVAVLALDLTQLWHFHEYWVWQQVINSLTVPVLVWNIYRLGGLIPYWWTVDDRERRDSIARCRQRIEEIEKMDPRYAAYLREELKKLEDECTQKN